ncbi:MAG: 4Fe-4S binding protein [Bacteroidetes bacterium]|nr:MAG: 4Fe-4S binding protein [Bacteroidota bacterium]
MQKKLKEKLVITGILLLLSAAWLLGSRYHATAYQVMAEEFLHSSPYHASRVNDIKWELTDSLGRNAGFAYLSKGSGYSGDIILLTLTDNDFRITHNRVLDHSETYSYYQKLHQQNFFENLKGKHAAISRQANSVDIISGATVSCMAIIQAIEASYLKAEGQKRQGLQMVAPGWKEALLLLLFINGIVLLKTSKPRLKKRILWLSQFTSVVFLGFWLNSYLTLTQINALMQGHLPLSSGGLFLAILLGGSILIPLFTGKNLYCQTVCPFGSAQRIIGLLGHPRAFRPSWHHKLKYLQWALTLVALSMALAFRNPAISDYTIFDNFFRIGGPSFLVAVTIITLLVSLVVSRPWCHFLCPLDGIFRWLKLIHLNLQLVWKSTPKPKRRIS